jgi:hypothetical protein
MKRLLPVTLFIALVLLSPLIASGEPLSKPPGVRVLFYGKGRMERTFRLHQDPRRAKTGDYIPTLRRRPDADCLTAVNWESRWMLAANVVLVVDFYDPHQKRYERHRCQVADYQQRRHSTGRVQRLEIDYVTAQRVNAVPSNTTARIVRVEE